MATGFRCLLFGNADASGGWGNFCSVFVVTIVEALNTKRVALKMPLKLRLNIGDCLCVTGRVRSSNKTGEVVLFANHVQKVDDPNIEVDRILRLDGGK